MYKIYIIPVIAMLLLHCCCMAQKHEQRVSKAVSIPFYYDANDDYSVLKGAKPTVVIVTDSKGNIIFTKKNFDISKGHWAIPSLQLTHTGRYNVHVKFYADSVSPKEFINYFDINGDEVKVELNINLLLFRDQENDIILNKYYDNKFNVKLKRMWNPQYLFESNKTMQPEYEWTNTYDSVLFGIRRQYSSWSTIGYVANWNVAYIQLQKLDGDIWDRIDCNKMLLEAPLKKGQTGKTLPDTAFDCKDNLFKLKVHYRVLLEYGLNDEIVRHTPANGKFEECFYYEPHIYQITDEFTLDH